MHRIARFLFEPTRECSLLGSRTVALHLLRGAIAATSLGSAVTTWSHPLAIALAIVVAILAMRGCPMCWVIGLAETVVSRVKV